MRGWWARDGESLEVDRGSLLSTPGGRVRAVSSDGTRVAEPTEVGSREVRLRLRPGGWVVVVPEARTDPALGTLEVHRGGVPFPFVEIDGKDPPWSLHSPGIVYSVPVRPGGAIGPLVPGRHRFEVRLGALELEPIAVDVEAGTFAVARVRLPR